MAKKIFDLSKKVAVVTGGARGIGKAITEKFLIQGSKVHVLELNADICDLQRYDNFIVHTCDISKGKMVNDVIDKIFADSHIDILVNNAGIAHVGNIEHTTEKDMDMLYNVNIKGVYNCVNAIIPKMKKNVQGVIINMASIASSVGIRNRFAYSMTKGAVLSMTYSIAKDYIDDGIRCNSVSPARIHTPFIDNFIANNYPGEEANMLEALSKTQPIGRMGTPEEVAGLVTYLCSDEASFITGTDFPIDGGFIKLNGN